MHTPQQPHQTPVTPLSFAMLIDPASVLAAADRAAKLDLPRRICRPLDRRMAIPLSAEVAAYDADVEETTIIEDEAIDTPLAA